jgi:hypothetical protein
MTDVHQLINKHRGSGLLVDTNLLLLYLIGRTNKNRILNFKRTQAYTIDDFDLLNRFMAEFKVLITPPHVLTEVSNLGDLQRQEREVFRSCFVQIVEQSREHYDERLSAVQETCFRRLGLTDAAIAALASQGFLFLTDDLDLYLTLVEQRVDAINFNHLRPLNWKF